MKRLKQLLTELDGNSYGAYKSIQGKYQFPTFHLSIDHVQSDPFAAPTRVSLNVAMSTCQIPPQLWLVKDPYFIRKIALEDYLGRTIQQTIIKVVKGKKGSGVSGEVAIAPHQQQVLQRNAVIAKETEIEIRITMGLPAKGRRIDGRQAQLMFFEELPKLIDTGLRIQNINQQKLQKHIECVEDQVALRHWLDQNQFVAFIADGSILPRASGVSDKPLTSKPILFRSPDSLRQTVTLPNAGDIMGMAIPSGVTLIVGGGFHGKSTLLNALEYGPYNHIPGDGREKIATLPSACKIRAEDGRSIAKVNISPFINNLPFGRDTVEFSTDNASGSTSQAANIIEAFEANTKLLLIDEDTSATNFMIRDQRMQQLVSNEKEPITPLLFRVRELFEKHQLSSIIVMGGSGDYFNVADTVIMLDAYSVKDVTTKALQLATTINGAISNNPVLFSRQSPRRPGANALNPSRGARDVKIDTKGLSTLHYGEHKIDLSLVEQLVDIGQTRAIGLMIHYYAKHYANSTQNLIEGLEKVHEDVLSKGLDIISPYKVGYLAMPRLFELAAAINRIREGEWH